MLEILMLIIGSLLGVVFLSLMERKILSSIQIRKGPNKVLIMGLVQSILDAMKLFTKEQMMLYKMNKLIYIMNPLGLVSLSMMIWLLYPIYFSFSSLEFGVLLFICVLSLESYFLLFMGWFSSNKFSMLGGVRGVVQMISYEIVFFLVILSFIYSFKSSNFSFMNYYQKFYFSSILYLNVYFSILYISSVAELNRSPMDLVEGESELVSGFNIEYMSFTLSLIFIGEFSGMLISMLILWSIFMGNMMLMGGLLLVLLLLVIRALYPRMRYDKLMFMFWKSILPVSLGLFYIFLSF